MERRKLPKKERPKGLFLYCNTHDKHYPNDAEVKCKCNNLVYKARIHVPNTTYGVKSKVLEANDFVKAFNLFKEYQNELKVNSFQNKKFKKVERIPTFLTEYFAYYMGFLNNVNVPKHKHKIRSENYIKKFDRDFEIYKEALKKNNIDANILNFTDVNDDMVGWIHEYLLTVKKYANKTYNNAMANYSTFTSHVIKKFSLNYNNPFLGVENREVTMNNLTVEENDFYNLLDSLSHEEGYYYQEYKGLRVRKNCYKPWLKEGFLLGLFTGGRSEEIQQIRWSGITLKNDGSFKDLEVIHYKLNKAKAHLVSANDNIIKKFTITKELGELLLVMGYKENKGSSDYILAPLRENRVQVGKELSKGFSHFYRKLNNGEDVTFKNLRKTYATSSFLEFGSASIALTEHKGINVLISHYFNRESTKNKARQGWGVFKGLKESNDDLDNKESKQDN